MEGADGCQCEEGLPFEVRDTICGRNPLTNLFYLLLFICGVLYFLGTLSFFSFCMGKLNFRFRTRLKLLIASLLVHSLSSHTLTLAKVIKPLDIVIHYPPILYAFI